VSDAPPEPRGLRDVLAHAAVVATAWALGELCVLVLWTLLFTASWATLGFAMVAGILRRSCLVGIAAALAAYRRPRCSRPRAALECALIALLCTHVGFALAVGSSLSEEVTGAAVVGGGTTLSVEDAIQRFVGFVASPWTYLRVVGLAVGLYLGAGRRGRWSEGLALRAPVALTSFNAGMSLVAVPIVAIALPLLTRAAERLFVRREP
jgi:hypothetical protein